MDRSLSKYSSTITWWASGRIGLCKTLSWGYASVDFLRKFNEGLGTGTSVDNFAWPKNSEGC